MKVLSLKQPWAELILQGEKDVENRTWDAKHRGPFLIHASKTFDLPPYHNLLRQFPDLPPCVQGFTRGAIVGAARLVDSTQTITSKWHEVGLFGFYLEDVVRLDEPIYCRGRLGLFNLESMADLRERTRHTLSRWVANHYRISETEYHHG